MKAGRETSPESQAKSARWLWRWTVLDETARALTDESSAGLCAWARTTAGIVALLVALQLCTGLLLAFYYVPSAESARVTVSYIEKVIGGGSWIRALHAYGSAWLPLALVLHLAQMFWRGSYRRQSVAWLASVVLLALTLAAGATGYSLPWDARAFYSTRVAAGIARGLPLVGEGAQRWLIGGDELSTLTVSRFFALHAFLVPLLLLTIIVARLFVFRERSRDGRIIDETRQSEWARTQLARNTVSAGLVFVALSWYAAKHPASLAPAPEAAPDYLPRPGAQFLWLFQLLKFLPGTAASLAAFLVPGILLAGLALIPFLNTTRLTKLTPDTRRIVGALVFLIGFVLVAGLTTAAYLADARDPRVREQLARQAAAEQTFRQAPFVPLRVRSPNPDHAPANRTASPPLDGGARSSSPNSAVAEPPAAYIQLCARCHGAHGEGVRPYPQLIGISAQPRRSAEDIIAILNNPAAFGLQRPMVSFAHKLTDEERRQIAEWVEALK